MAVFAGYGLGLADMLSAERRYCWGGGGGGGGRIVTGATTHQHHHHHQLRHHLSWWEWDGGDWTAMMMLRLIIGMFSLAPCPPGLTQPPLWGVTLHDRTLLAGLHKESTPCKIESKFGRNGIANVGFNYEWWAMELQAWELFGVWFTLGEWEMVSHYRDQLYILIISKQKLTSAGSLHWALSSVSSIEK